MKNYPDISHYKTVTSWSELKKNYPFIIMKATQGTDNTDPKLFDTISKCEKHGIHYWVYTFLDKGNELAQAKYMVKVCKPKVGKYFVGYILDVERSNTAADVKKALDYIKTQSVKTMIYTGYAKYDMYKSLLEKRGSNCAWWESRYGLNDGKYNPKYPAHKGVDLLQYTDKGKCAGVGIADMNAIVGSKPESWFTTPGKKATTESKPKTPAKKSVTAIAKEVIAGKWGDGDARKAKLKKAGYDYNAVQKEVNKLLK